MDKKQFAKLRSGTRLRVDYTRGERRGESFGLITAEDEYGNLGAIMDGEFYPTLNKAAEKIKGHTGGYSASSLFEIDPDQRPGGERD